MVVMRTLMIVRNRGRSGKQDEGCKMKERIVRRGGRGEEQAEECKPETNEEGNRKSTVRENVIAWPMPLTYTPRMG